MVDLKIHSEINEISLMEQAEVAKNLHGKLRLEEMTGWMDLPDKYEESELEEILETAREIQRDSDYLVCVGIGGSYLGHRAIIEALSNKSKTKVLYAGESLSSLEFRKLLETIGESNFSVLVISKSGSTIEPAVAFRLMKKKLIEKYGESQAQRRIYVTTGESGVLYEQAVKNDYKRFRIPNNIGGRYSVLTAVGLLPMAVAGIDVISMISGQRQEKRRIESGENLSVYKYATARHLLRSQGYMVEALVSFEPGMRYFLEWWKQLFGESEGKEDQGILPVSLVYTTDLHSMGQYMQQGQKNIFETMIGFDEINDEVEVPNSDIVDGLDCLEGRGLNYINKQAMLATIEAHKFRMPVFELRLSDLSEESLGGLIYFFELACALSARLQGVNPFDQPGVEKYKNEMYKLLGKR